MCIRDRITIYPIQSPALTAFDDQPERWLDVRWEIDDARRELYPAQIFVRALNEPGALGVIATAIGEAQGNIDSVTFKQSSPDFRDLSIDIEVLDLKHLTMIIQQLRGKSVVNKVERVNEALPFEETFMILSLIHIFRSSRPRSPPSTTSPNAGSTCAGRSTTPSASCTPRRSSCAR